ncbi:alpha/beta hydrolase [Megasphaera sp. DISK 18]|uniref:alpha/beta hydrolase n=1 Tax=Megasphaera sp. DISK 18 TaxID=1776081 RepID=UPI0008070425|nr:alpha/beta hydrolase [Megasphaera sp. DISK 18]OBZ32517.1 esterase [Megasphaera sp. DISK 18]
MIKRTTGAFSLDSTIRDVIQDEAFSGFGRLLFPVHRPLPPSMTLRDLGKALIWYSHVKPQRTVSIVNDLYARATAGETIFYDIYSPEEKANDPAKRETGLFFFRGKPNGKTAILSAGGGFAYVAAMQDSFPHAQELAKRGYNAFAIIYRPDAQKACEDLARAIAFIHDHARELNIDVSDYSLWGGSAGARMAAWVGTYGTGAFGERPYPQPAAVIMEYTGLSDVIGNEPPTYNCVGTADGIAWYGTMKRRIEGIRAHGTDADIEIFPGLPHGFGLGEGTVAEGWIHRAVSFWQRQMKD